MTCVSIVFLNLFVLTAIMIYLVVLVECGRVTHRWHYDCHLDALRQLERLLTAYIEVNEVVPLLLKIGLSEVDLKTKDLLSNYVFE